jgi:putative ABC transport system permease protein
MKPLLGKWVWQMALRDARHGFKPLILSSLCVVLGVASVVSAFSFRDNLRASIRTQSKSLLGADLAIDSRAPFSAEAEALFSSLGGDQSRQISFSSMVYFPATGSSRLVQVRAVSGKFPYYGALETEPSTAAKDFQRGAHALVDERVMLQFNARAGDRVRIGDQDFPIAGKLRKIPGETLAFSLISPRIYIPLSYLNQTQLIQKGSLVRYRVYFNFDSRLDVDQLVQRISPQLQRLGLQADTVSRRAESISTSMDNLSRYLQLAVFIAVLLAGVGVASGVHVYVKEKTSSVAVLRCIGATPRETVIVYLIQVLMFTLAGAVAGAALGAGLESLLPLALKDFLPVNTSMAVAPAGLGAGMVIGLGAAILFSLIALLPLRKVSPLLALRSSYETGERNKDPLLWLICLLIIVGVMGFAVATTANWLHGVWFTAGVVLTFGLLVAVARGVSILLRKLIPGFLSFPWRQGLANLHRPNNQTTAVMLSIGLGTFLLVTLYNVRSMLMNQVAARSGTGEPNLVLFDVQKNQKQAIADLVHSFSTSLYEEVPVVTMRLAAVKGKRVEELRDDVGSRIPRWALRREYRSTYRNHLSATERIIAGKWQDRVKDEAQPIPISLEKGISESLGVRVGDSLEFDVQGISLRTRVASLREVDWQRVQPNFFVVLPEGVLENAPQFYAVVTRTDSSEASASLQRAVAERFPNVSVIDLTLVLSTLDSILGRVSDAIRFVALFTILTGFAVLASAVLSSRGQRLKESILLRTLGAPWRQIVSSAIAEYMFLGLISGLTGAALAIAASWGLSFYFFKTVAAISVPAVVSLPLLVTGITVVAGALGCWGIFRRSALEALRAET